MESSRYKDTTVVLDTPVFMGGLSARGNPHAEPLDVALGFDAIDLLPKARLVCQVGGVRSRLRFRRLPFDRANTASIEIAPRRGGRVTG